jgi:D-xylose transport system substrate-binding protein
MSSNIFPRNGAQSPRVVGALFAVLAVLGVGCSKAPSSAAAGEKAPPGAPKVAFLLATLQEERYLKDQKYFEARAKALGLSVFTLAADNENARQLAQVEDALSRGAKVLVVQPTDSAAASSYVERAHAKGAKLVAYDRGIKSPALDAYVSHDSFRVGVLMAEAAVKATNGKGNYVLLNGQSGHSVALEIARGYHDVLRPYVARGDIKIVVEKSHDAWSPEQSLKTVEDALSKTRGDVQAILSNNSGMARGAVQALRASGRRAPANANVFVGGADADAANVNYVCEGSQAVEVLKDIAPLAEAAADVAAALARGTAISGASPTNVIAVNVSLVTAANARAVLVDSGFHLAQAVPACLTK